ncbi:MAG: hypothetical protein HYV09_24710 [Deltaproteobacteria bacterium]|nr:hypothetical protein [Deltaproteobacteria bacterium]
MAAMTQERKVQKLSERTVVDLLYQPMKANARIYLGAIAVLNAGYVAPGTSAKDLVALGIAEETIDNTGGADGARFAPVRQGAFKLANSLGPDAITQADVGKDCFIVDDQTVARTDGGGARSRAGKVVQLEPDGVFVQLGIGL